MEWEYNSVGVWIVVVIDSIQQIDHELTVHEFRVKFSYWTKNQPRLRFVEPDGYAIQSHFIEGSLPEQSII